MKNLYKLVGMVVFAIASFGVMADQVKVSTGSNKGTYHALFTDIAGKCGEQMALVEMNSSGSAENLANLTGKKAGLAFTQTDALFALAQGQDLGAVKTLVAFNKESVHVVTLVNTGLKAGGTMGFGAKPVVFNNAEDLANMNVAAAGGSMITAQLVKSQGQIPWNVVPAKDNDEALGMLKSGQVQAVVMVGGQPLGNVVALGQEYKLVGFKPGTVELLKTIYVGDKLSYPKLSATAVSTIATEALLVTRTYNTPDKLKMLGDFRSCVLKNVPEWQDADGSHPAWAQVDVNNHGKWQYYDLPAATVVAKKK